MKRLSLAAAGLAALAMVSCNKKPSSSHTPLRANIDSVSYAIGVQNAEQILLYLPLQGKLDTANIENFVRGFAEVAYAKSDKKVDSDYESGKAIATDMVRGLEDAYLFPDDSTTLINRNAYLDGIVETLLKASDAKITSEQARSVIKNFTDARTREQFAEQIAANEKFLDDNRNNEGILTTRSGLQYRINVQGSGAVPEKGDRVRVNYKGTLIDGTVFDSNEGRPAFEFNNDRGVIEGWQEIAQMMPVGSKWTVYIPAELGYGSDGMGKIPPYSTLIFDIEMLDIVK